MTSRHYLLNSWDHRFLQLALHVAQWSKDPSTRVGAVIANNLRQVIGMGYNGFPRGVSDAPARLSDRPTKYAMVLHAEANAILNATQPVRGATIYVTHHPCSNCAALIIQSGLSNVVVAHHDEALAERFAASFGFAQTMFSEAKVGLYLP